MHHPPFLHAQKETGVYYLYYCVFFTTDFSQPLASYDGQVSLCPVDYNGTDKLSTSFGLVRVHYVQNGATKGINQKGDTPLGGIEADAVCRQMGFTGAYPRSAMTREVYNYTFNNCL